MSSVTLYHGFGIETRYQAPLGKTIEQLCNDTIGYCTGVVAFVRCPEGARQQWEAVPRHMWQWVKPIGRDCLRFEITARGGGDNIFRVIAAVVIAVGAPFLGGIAAAGLGFTGTALSLATAAISATIALGATALVNNLFAPSTPATPAFTSPRAEAEQQQTTLANVDTDQNLLAKGAKLAKVLGTQRVVPHDVCYPHRYLQGGREVISRVLGLEGQHDISDIKLGDISIESIPDTVYEVSSGDSAAGHQQLIKAVTRPTNIGQTLSKFILEADSENLSDQVNPSQSEPKAVVFAPGYHKAMSEVTLRIGLSPFIFLGQSANPEDITQTLRMQFWSKASPATKYKLPEIAIRGRKASDSLKEIRFRWDGDFGDATQSQDFRYSFIGSVPATAKTLSNGQTGPQWEAHAHFLTGTGVRNITSSGDGINVVLDERIFPRDDYEFEITAGLPIISSTFNTSSYTLNSVVESLFHSFDDEGAWSIPAEQRDVSASIQAMFATLIVDRPPVARPGVTEIGLVIKDKDARNINCVASGYFHDWDGSGWNTYGPTNNPATLAYNLYREWLSLFGVNESLINSDQHVGWRAECIARDRTASFIATGQPVPELIDHMCTAGFATKRVDSGYSIEYHRDRSSEIPVMTFSHRDSVISIEREFAESPKGIRSTFRNRDLDWSEDEVDINNRYGTTPFSENEQIDYPAIDRLSKIVERVDFDLLQVKYRNFSWSVRTGPAGHNRVKGDLVGIVTDLLTDLSHGFFIRQVLGPRLLALDRAVPDVSQADLLTTADLTTVSDLKLSGNVSVAHILTKSGVQQYSVSDVERSVLELNEDLQDQDVQGSRITLAARAELFHRGFVFDNQRVSDQTASLIVVPEAQIIEQELRKFHGT